MASERLQEAVAGAVGAAISTSALYPLEIAKTIMLSRTGKDSSRDSTVSILAGLVSTSGPLAVYKGLPTKTAQSVVQTFGYFYFYAAMKQLAALRAGAEGPYQLGTFENLLAGYLAGVCNIGTFLPLEVRGVGRAAEARRGRQVGRARAFTADVLGVGQAGRGVCVCVHGSREIE